MDPYKIANVPFRPLLYALALIYLLLDMAFHGPMWERFERFVPGSATSQDFGVRHGWAATVNGKPITKDQLNLALDVFLARRGKIRADLPEKNLIIAQRAVLNELINDALIRQWSGAQPEEVPPQREAAWIAQFEASFAPGELKALCQSQDLSQAELHAGLREHHRQIYWLEQKVSEATVVTGEEAREWFGLYQPHLEAPEVIRARHIFLSTVNPPQDPEPLIRELAGRLENGEAGFAELAAEFSEDQRTRGVGGDLGYFSRRRMPEDFTTPVFQLQPGQRSEPFQTSIGWHLVEVQERLPARNLDFEEIHDEVTVYLGNEWRTRSLDKLLHEQLRIPRRARVEIFAPALELDD